MHLFKRTEGNFKLFSGNKGTPDYDFCGDQGSTNLLSISYIISSVMHAFGLVLSYDLLEDRRTDDDSARFKFDSCVIL